MRVRAASLLAACLLVATGPVAADDPKAAPPKSSYDHLKVLEKSVGRWEGKLTTGGLEVPATFSVEWMLDKQFLREELRVKLGGRERAVVIVRGWDAKAGVMSEHGFVSNGDSGSGTAKFGDPEEGKVAFTSSLAWASGRKVVGKQLIEFPEADRLVITLTAQTQDDKNVPDSKLELKRVK